MNGDPDGPSGGTVLAAVFLILAGLCLILVGGGCTLLLLGSFRALSGGSGTQAVPFLLLSLVLLGGGIAMVWLGVKLLRGGFNR
jgi:hypothetical protein